MIPQKPQLSDLNKRIWELTPPPNIETNQSLLLNKFTEAILNSKSSDIDELSLLDKLSFISEYTKTINDLEGLKLEKLKIEHEIEKDIIQSHRDSQSLYINKLEAALVIYTITRANVKGQSESINEELNNLRECLNFLNQVKISETSGLQ